jgi:hypothetical protein
LLKTAIGKGEERKEKGRKGEERRGKERKKAMPESDPEIFSLLFS